MSPVLLLLAMLLFSPRPFAMHGEAVGRIAGAVGAATDDEREQDVLLALAFTETTWGRPRSVPFGATARNRAGRTVREAAADSLESIREGLRRCGGTVRGVAAYYLSGSCAGRYIVEGGKRVDYSLRVARAYEGIRRRHAQARRYLLAAEGDAAVVRAYERLRSRFAVAVGASLAVE